MTPRSTHPVPKMPEALMLLLAMVAGLTGMAWLALAKLPHWRQVTGEPAQRAGTRRRLRIAGATALSLSLGLCLAADHVSMSFLVWIMIIAAGALSVAFALAYQPRTLRWLVPRSRNVQGTARPMAGPR
jgi:hypothetical protein